MKTTFIVRANFSWSWAKWLGRGVLIGCLLLINATGLFKGYSVDGVAGATVVKPSVALKVTASPRRNNSNVIKVAEGQPLVIHLKAIDSTDKKRKNLQKLHALSVTLESSLPAGSSFVNTCLDDPNNTCGEGVFTWTPQAGDAANYFAAPPILIFRAYSSSLHLNSKPKQAILLVQDNTAPAFDDALPDTLAATAGSPQKLDIIVKPSLEADGTAHKLKILLDPETPLPKGAKLGRTHLGSDGNWHRTLSWKPKLNQQGVSGGLNFVAENADVDATTAALTQAEYVLDYSVAPVAAP